MNLDRITFILITIFSGFLSYYVLSNAIESLDRIENDLILGVMIPVGIFICKAGLVFLGIYSLFQIIKKRKYVYLVPLFIVISAFIISIVIWHKIKTRESNPIILEAFYDGDMGGLSLILRKDKTYQLGDYGILGGTDHYGNYYIKNDTIYLDKKFPLGKDRDLIDNKFLIVDSLILLKADSNGIYQVDEYMKMKILKK